MKEICEQRIPFNAFLGIRVKEIRSGRVKLILPFRKEWIGDVSRPAIHGGVISTLADTAGGAAAWTKLSDGDRLSTVDLLVDYLVPGKLADLTADAIVVRIGNSVAVTQIVVSQGPRNEAVARARAVYNIVRSKEKGSTTKMQRHEGK
jgi:uncharacterized protein (TIGR00369 family)